MNSLANKRPYQLLPAVFVFVTSLLWLSLANAAGEDSIRTTDYYISHESNEPFYARHGVDPNVLLHVREVVMAGRERTVREDGKVLVLIHGATFPGYVAFDTNAGGASIMRHFAQLGWDTFALDLEGYGMSTRPIIMDTPEAFPNDPAPIRSDVTMANVGRVVDFVRDLRGVDKVHLLGWSLGADIEAPRYTILHPDKVSKLVLLGVNYQGWGESEDDLSAERDGYDNNKMIFGYPALIERWAGLGTKPEFVIRSAFDAYREEHLASDPKSGERGGAVRAPAGRFFDLTLEKPHFDAEKITVPTLVINGDADADATQEDNQALMEALDGEENKLVVIPGAGHFLHFEKVNMQFYSALQEFLDPKKN
ncbi:MAG: alpha/beta hydrolase [Alphaproteobacteria bacterium]